LPRLPTGVGGLGAADAGAEVVPEAEPPAPKKPSAAALLGKGRAPKRHRRAL
jgi:hypothetical protein